MLKEAIFHQPLANYAFPLSKNRLKVRLRTARNDVKKCTVFYGDRYAAADPENFVEMKLVARDRLFDYHEAVLVVETGRFRYIFFLEDDNEGLWYNERGLFLERPRGWHSGYFQFPYIFENEILSPPQWVRDAVFYQIFPERFCNGDPSNDPQGVKKWGELPQRGSFFGGDLEGIRKKLPYLEELGVNALYLNPVFTSPTNHKYDTADYFNIDPAFGSKEDFRRLVDEAHHRGMRVILDGVFNHSGFYFEPFQDLVKKEEASSYRDWFNVSGFPVEVDPEPNYETFATGISSMPKLRTDRACVQEYLLEVATYWVREFDIDGWRLDVADEVSPDFWKKLRKALKSLKQDIFLVGEVWHRGQYWLQGDMFDSIMNYDLAFAIHDFFGRGTIGAGSFNDRLTKNRMAYPEQVNAVLFNLLDSHDYKRVLTVFNGDKRRLKLAVFFQMTYTGVPVIYYGDEIGMAGGDDPDCRRPMIWDEKRQDRELFSHYQRLIKIRHKEPALRRGDIHVIYADESSGLFAFSRTYKNRTITMILNNSPLERKIGLKKLYLQENEGIIDLYSQESPGIQEGKLIIGPFEGKMLTSLTGGRELL